MKIGAKDAAYVSGGGSGIGRALCLELAGRGVNVGVCDIRGDDAEETARLVRAKGVDAVALAVDVSDQAAVDAAADEIEAAFGPVSLVCNNAGVAMHGVPIEEISLEEWEWVFGVNMYGAIHGARTFVPRLRALGRPAHILNTASIGGFQVNADFMTTAYSMTKYAVVALSEGLRNELAGTDIGISVLAPAAVDSGIHLSERSRPERLGGPYVREQNHFLGDLIKGTTQPEEIALRAITAVENGDFYIFTHPETRQWLDARFTEILGAFNKPVSATSSSLLSDVS